jgi:hydrogenase maturation protein HypF
LKTREHNTPEIQARRIRLTGLVQGVGFRPFVYRLALDCSLKGWVRNCMGQVEIHVQGLPSALDLFHNAIFEQAPSLARPRLQSSDIIEPEAFSGFSILPSSIDGDARIHVPADLFTCDACVQELNDPADRRYRYPFINCTQCGPRYTIIRVLPYDRPNTTMAGFELCTDCRAEYEDPMNRRYHAEPVACPVCGPTLSFHIKGSEVVNDNAAALAACVAALRGGATVAVKGIGGYHLMCDARNDAAVLGLRSNKPRPHKPLAVMLPSSVEQPFAQLDRHVELDDEHKTLLASAARPILLALRKQDSTLSIHIAPGLAEVGVMLPYSPLHHLLLQAFDAPLVATSANISGEPVLTDNAEVENRLRHVADAFLHHDRPIERPADDPVFRIIHRKPRPIRLGRGYAPQELELPFELERPVLAVGAHMKNTIALAWGRRAVVSPHIGEMDSARSLAVFERCIADLQSLYRVEAERIVCDAHPGYSTTRWAKQRQLPVHTVYHHHAHASAAWAENALIDDLAQDVLAFTWDGVGFGEDGTLWGGEALFGRPGGWKRVASMRPFYLPGGERAGREPWRSAAALCWQSGGHCDLLGMVDPMLREAWRRRLNTPQTSAVGRLFDAAAALTGICTQASFEGQGPMMLEAVCDDSTVEPMPLPLDEINGLLQCDWGPLLPLLLDENTPPGQRAMRFHVSMAHTLRDQAVRIRRQTGVNDVCLCGGVFQNRVLSECVIALLEADDFKVCLPETVPVNDAGISFGQIIEYGYPASK